MSYQRVSILGCGWLGFPLGVQLLRDGHFVRGSTTTKEKIPLIEEAGIEPYFIQLNPIISGDDVISFFNVDTVILNIPPPKVDNRTTFMRQQGEELVSYLNNAPVKKLIMVSSTGVYGFQNQEADETDSHPPETQNGKGLLALEKQLSHELNASVSIIRMAGLIGPGRNPGRFLSGREISGNGEEPVNLIHQKDAIGTVISLLKNTDISGIYNACAQSHPTRKQFYNAAAKKMGLHKPHFKDQEERPWKTINSGKIRKTTGYQFIYDDPVSALDDMEEP